jgi:endonuclease YncB( thermonuclease family)
MKFRVIAFFFFFSWCAGSQEMQGKIISVFDGNTIELQTIDNEIFKFVFAGVDCPELEQDFGLEAKTYIEKLLSGKEVTVTIEGKDRLGNKVGMLKFKGRDPRLELLARGLAWTVEQNPNVSFEELKEIARKSGKGLWKQENPTPPWTYRRQQTMATAKSS